MTVQNDTNVKTYTGNGVTTVFPYDFFIPGDSTTDQANVEVTLLEIDTGIEGDPLADVLWSITGVGEDTYGNVTYTGGGTPLPATYKINIRRVVPYEQNLDLTTQSAYFPELLEEQLDLMVYQIQQLAEETARSVKVAIGSEDDPDALVQGVLDALEDTQAAATSAATSATAAAASETAAETAETNAETAETNAEASAVAAAASATAAAASETAAELAETNAETAQAAAEAAQAAAAASYDSFDDRYLGAKAADPVLDNDGAALLTGALYWNTVSNELRIWDGAIWRDAVVVAGSLGDLSDVDLDTTPPASGDGLTFDGVNWVPGAAGGGMFRGNNGTVGSRSGDIFRINAQTLTEDVTIGATENASATGPIAIETGNVLTVASGGTLAIV